MSIRKIETADTWPAIIQNNIEIPSSDVAPSFLGSVETINSFLINPSNSSGKSWQGIQPELARLLNVEPQRIRTMIADAHAIGLVDKTKIQAGHFESTRVITKTGHIISLLLFLTRYIRENKNQFTQPDQLTQKIREIARVVFTMQFITFYYDAGDSHREGRVVFQRLHPIRAICKVMREIGYLDRSELQILAAIIRDDSEEDLRNAIDTIVEFRINPWNIRHRDNVKMLTYMPQVMRQLLIIKKHNDRLYLDTSEYGNNLIEQITSRSFLPKIYANFKKTGRIDPFNVNLEVINMAKDILQEKVRELQSLLKKEAPLHQNIVTPVIISTETKIDANTGVWIDTKEAFDQVRSQYISFYDPNNLLPEEIREWVFEVEAIDDPASAEMKDRKKAYLIKFCRTFSGDQILQLVLKSHLKEKEQ